MTVETRRAPMPANEGAAGARLELASLFERPRPAVAVTVKRRKLPAKTPVAQGDVIAPEPSPGSGSAASAAERSPKVHRWAATAGRAASGMDQVSKGSGVLTPLRTTRTRARRDALRRPSPVHVVVQAPPRVHLADGEAAWRQLLGVEPQEGSYRQVLRALDEVRALLHQARCANRFLPKGAAA